MDSLDYQGYKRALEEAGIPVRDEYVRVGNYRYESGMDAMKYFLKLITKTNCDFLRNRRNGDWCYSYDSR